MLIDLRISQAQPIVVRLDFPALADLVAYLTGQQQGQIDSLVAQVQQLAAKLQQSSSALAGAENTKG